MYETGFAYYKILIQETPEAGICGIVAVIAQDKTVVLGDGNFGKIKEQLSPSSLQNIRNKFRVINIPIPEFWLTTYLTYLRGNHNTLIFLGFILS